MVGLLALTACGSRRSYNELLIGEAGGQQAVSGAGPRATQSASGASTTIPAATAAVGSPTASTGSTPNAEVVGSGAGPGPDGGGGDAAATCSGTEAPIILGSVGTQSGLVGSILGPSALAVQAWAAAVNAKGGLKCHPIKYLLADDGGDPSKHQALVQQMVEQNHVVAFLQMNAVLTGQASVAYLTQHNIPVIGDEGGSQWFNEHPNYFPVFASGDPDLKMVFAGGVAAAKNAGKTKLGTFNCIEASICSAVYDKAVGYAQEFGVTLVYRGQGSLAQPDFTSACQQAKDAGVEVMVAFMDGNSMQRIGRSCNSVGFHPLYVASALALTQSLPGDPNLDGLLGALTTMPWLETGNPVVAEEDQVIRQYAPGLPPSAATMQGYVAAKVFEAAIAATDDPLTSDGILRGLWTIKANDIAGTTYPLTFTEGQNAPEQYCVWTVKISGGQYVSGGSAPADCGTGG